MAAQHEARSARDRRASENVGLGGLDVSEDSIPLLICNRIKRRFGISAEVANAVAQLAGLGPREARR